MYIVTNRECSNEPIDRSVNKLSMNHIIDCTKKINMERSVICTMTRRGAV
jgi:hypothetical protein